MLPDNPAKEKNSFTQNSCDVKNNPAAIRPDVNLGIRGRAQNTLPSAADERENKLQTVTLKPPGQVTIGKAKF